MLFQIISVEEKHISQILELMREFAEYEKLLDYFEVTAERLKTALFGDGKVAEAIVSEQNGELAGYAVFYPNFATFRGQRGFYLEDIFISRRFRGQGLGERMLQEIARRAKSRGFERIDFQVLEWNTSAIGFYQKLGAVCDSEDRHFKFTDEAFRNLAT